jgi:hypothetical protein
MSATATREATVTVPAPVHLAAAKPMRGSSGAWRTGMEFVALFTRGASSALVATCARALAYVPCEAAETAPGRTLIPAAAVKGAKRAKRGTVPALRFTFAGIATPDGVTHPYGDANFPPVSDTIPAQLGNRVAVAFNAELLANLAASLGATDGKATLYVDPENKLPAIMVPHGADGFGLLMPCAHDDDAKRRAAVEADLAAARALTK